MRYKVIAAMMAPCLLASAQPAVAQDIQNFQPTYRKTVGFAGLTVRMSVQDQELKSTARLGLGLTHRSTTAGGTFQSHGFGGSALELGLSKLGKADFYVAGQKLTDAKARFGLAPLAVVAVVAGGVAVGGVALASLHNGKPRDPKTGCPTGIEVCTQ
jgi:hypothetical protein